MTTSIAIPDKLLREAVRLTKARTKQLAVLAVLDQFTQRARMAELIKYSGTFDSLMSNEEIEGLDSLEPHHESRRRSRR